MDVIGYDEGDRAYLVLDDNRLYRRTDAPLPPEPNPQKTVKSKAKSKSESKAKSSKASSRSSKRRKTSPNGYVAADEDVEEKDDAHDETEEKAEVAEPDIEDPETNTFGHLWWECVAVTLTEYNNFLSSIEHSTITVPKKANKQKKLELQTKIDNQEALYDCITNDVLPIIRGAEEERLKKESRREKELIVQERMARAKRSTRLAGRAAKEAEEAAAAAAASEYQKILAEARREQERQRQAEGERKERIETRTQRMKERNYRRALKQEERDELARAAAAAEEGEARMSERKRKAELKKKQKEIEEMPEEEWVFDCVKCGVHGENVDDGSHIVACERCNVWQHTACLGFSESEANNRDFHFVCQDCLQKEADAKKPKLPTLKIKLNGTGQAPAQGQAAEGPSTADQPGKRKRGRPPLTEQQKAERAERKRQEAEAAGTAPAAEKEKKMPPLKKFKPSAYAATGANPPVSTLGPNSTNDMHHTFMNGPTLGPSGPYTHANGMNGTTVHPPPGLTSPVRHSPYTNDVAIQPRAPSASADPSLYIPQSSQPNWPAQTGPMSQASSALNGNAATSSLQNLLDSTHVTTQPNGAVQQQQRCSPNPSFQIYDPAAAAAATSTNRPFSPTNPSPLANAPTSFSPTKPAGSSRPPNTNAAPATPASSVATNGIHAYPSGSAYRTPSFSGTPHLHTAASPPLPPSAASTAGYGSRAGLSPTKHSPAIGSTRPDGTKGNGISNGESTPVQMPPAPRLSPSPEHVDTSVPVKKLVPPVVSETNEL